MLDYIKLILSDLEETQDYKALIDDYNATRLRIQEEIKSRLNPAAESNLLMNDIKDLATLSRDEGILIGLYYANKMKN